MEELIPLLKDTWNFFKRHLVPICVIILPFIALLSMLSILGEGYASSESQLLWFTVLSGAVIYPVYQAALILYLASAVSGNYFSVKKYYRLALSFWLPLLLLYIISIGFLMAGLIMFIFPGLIVMARISFSEFYCVLNKRKSFESFSESWKATREKQWVILVGLIVIFIITRAPMWGVGKLITFLDAWSPVITFIINSIESILMVPLTIFCFRVFSLHQDAKGPLNKVTADA